MHDSLEFVNSVMQAGASGCIFKKYRRCRNLSSKKLYANLRTVEAHRRNIKTKLNIDTFAVLVRYAVNQGLIESSINPYFALKILNKYTDKNNHAYPVIM